MQIIDAHMHFFDIPGFAELARLAGDTNTAAGWKKVCRENNIVFSIAMGNSEDAPSRFGGVPPRLIDLAGPFEEQKGYEDIGLCLGVDSEAITEKNADKTAQEFEWYLKRFDNVVGLKFYMGYNHVYLGDERHGPLFELAEKYNVPVAMHSGETVSPDGILKYAHPLTVDEVAVEHRNVQFVICHIGNPWVADAVEVAAKNENVALDFSGLWEHRINEEWSQILTPFIEHVAMWVAYHGIWDKIMYGSDWPLINIKDNVRELARMVPERYQEAFFAENAKRIYPRIGEILRKRA